jgi:hypothetical protein
VVFWPIRKGLCVNCCRKTHPLNRVRCQALEKGEIGGGLRFMVHPLKGATMESYWISLGVLLLLVVILFVHWFFFDTGIREQPDYDKIRGYRDWKAQSSSYSEMQEWRDAIEEELEKGRKKGETPWQRLRRWWKS